MGFNVQIAVTICAGASGVLYEQDICDHLIFNFIRFYIELVVGVVDIQQHIDSGLKESFIKRSAKSHKAIFFRLILRTISLFVADEALVVLDRGSWTAIIGFVFPGTKLWGMSWISRALLVEHSIGDVCCRNRAGITEVGSGFGSTNSTMWASYISRDSPLHPALDVS